MTTVRMERAGDWFSVEAVGHATGNQNVCTAISTILGTLETWLTCMELTRCGSVDRGESRLRFTGSGCGTAFDIVYCGFRRLAETYPEYIQLNVEDPPAHGAVKSAAAPT